MKKTIHILRQKGLQPLVDVALFALITVAFHLAWRLGRPLFEEWPLYITMSDAMSTHVYRLSVWLAKLLPGLSPLRVDASCTMVFQGAGSLIVDHTCSGLKQFYQAFFLFLLYPGPRRHKLWYIPLAILVMHLVNIFRVVMLAVVMVHAYTHWDFMHDWVLRPLFYLVMFVLWMIWNERYRHHPKIITHAS